MNILTKIFIAFFLSSTACFGSSVEYQWHALDREWSFSLNLSNDLYDVYSQRTRFRDYDLFVTDSFDDKLIGQLTKYFSESLSSLNFQSIDVLKFVAAFVQSLDYTNDLATKGIDEYPKFPFETLYDAAGDCEDTSILLAALQLDLKFEVILLEFDQHLAVAVALPQNSVDGYYVESEGKKYFYIETTGNNWDIGQLPDHYIGSESTILNLTQRPSFQLSSEYSYSYTNMSIELKSEISLFNLGSITSSSTEVKIQVIDFDDYIISESISSPFVVEEEELYKFVSKPLKFIYTSPLKVIVTVYYMNEPIDQLIGDWFYLKD